MIYYKPMTNHVRIMHTYVVPLLLQMRWFGQKPNNEIYLEVDHPEEYTTTSTIMRTSKFHKVIWDEIEESNESSFKRVRLRLEGFMDSEKIFALLWFNLRSPNDGNLKIVFSPVPFGTDGKPMLLCKNDALIMFLAVAKIVLNTTCIWNIERLKAAISATKNVRFKAPINAEANYYLGQLTELGLARYIDSEHIAPIVTPSEFEAIFGTKLPEVY